MSSRPLPPSLDEIAKSNPLVDGEQVKEIEALLEELRREGVTPRQYSLSSPFAPMRTAKNREDE